MPRCPKLCEVPEGHLPPGPLFCRERSRGSTQKELSANCPIDSPSCTDVAPPTVQGRRVLQMWQEDQERAAQRPLLG